MVLISYKFNTEMTPFCMIFPGSVINSVINVLGFLIFFSPQVDLPVLILIYFEADS